MKPEKYLELISLLGQAPDSQLDQLFSKECREFSGDDPIKFLRNLQDKCVFYSGSSDFVIKVIDRVLAGEVESEEDAKVRREELSRTLGL